MKILVYGAGNIGSLYAAKLMDAGHDVTILARGARLHDIRAHGIVLQECVTGRESTTQIIGDRFESNRCPRLGTRQTCHE